MRRKEAGGRIYRRRHTLKLVLSVCGGVLAFLILLGIFFFVYFQRYIVYLPDGSGIELVVPWLEGHDTPSFTPETDDTAISSDAADADDASATNGTN